MPRAGWSAYTATWPRGAWTPRFTTCWTPGRITRQARHAIPRQAGHPIPLQAWHAIPRQARPPVTRRIPRNWRGPPTTASAECRRWRRRCGSWATRWSCARIASRRATRCRSAPTAIWTRGSAMPATAFPPRTTWCGSTSWRGRPPRRGSRRSRRPRRRVRMREGGSRASSSTPATASGWTRRFGNGRCWPNSTARRTPASWSGSAIWTWRSSTTTGRSSPNGTGSGCRASTAAGSWAF